MKKKDKTRRAVSLSGVAGWYGTAAIVGAYLLVSFRVLEPDGVLYQLLNLSGAAGLAAISYVKGVRQTLLLNLFWGAIALVALAAVVS